jgi:hypothetical protein
MHEYVEADLSRFSLFTAQGMTHQLAARFDEAIARHGTGS